MKYITRNQAVQLILKEYGSAPEYLAGALLDVIGYKKTTELIGIGLTSLSTSQLNKLLKQTDYEFEFKVR